MRLIGIYQNVSKLYLKKNVDGLLADMGEYANENLKEFIPE